MKKLSIAGLVIALLVVVSGVGYMFVSDFASGENQAENSRDTGSLEGGKTATSGELEDEKTEQEEALEEKDDELLITVNGETKSIPAKKAPTVKFLYDVKIPSSMVVVDDEEQYAAFEGAKLRVNIKKDKIVANRCGMMCSEPSNKEYVKRVLESQYRGLKAEILKEFDESELEVSGAFVGYHLKDKYGEFYNFYKIRPNSNDVMEILVAIKEENEENLPTVLAIIRSLK